MVLESLEASQAAIKEIERTNRDLAAKIAIAAETKAKEKSVQFLLNFELSQVMLTINQIKKEISDLEQEHNRLVEKNFQVSADLRRFKNYFTVVNALQMERKESSMRKLRDLICNVDFAVEVHEEDPSRSVEAFTQIVRR